MWCKIGIDEMANPPLKRVHIIEDYAPANSSSSLSPSSSSMTHPSSSSSSAYFSSSSSFVEVEPASPSSVYEMEQTLPVSPKRKNSRILEQQPMEELAV